MHDKLFCCNLQAILIRLKQLSCCICTEPCLIRINLFINAAYTNLHQIDEPYKDAAKRHLVKVQVPVFFAYFILR